MNMASGKVQKANKYVTGTTYGTVSVPNNTITEIGSISLDAGQWLIIACADWASNGDGYRQIAINNGNLNPGRNQGNTTKAAIGKESYQQVVIYMDTITAIDCKVYAWQDSGTDVVVYPHCTAIRLL